MRDLARDCLAIAEAGLKGARPARAPAGMIPDETHFLNALKDIVANGRTPAEELLAHLHGDWHGDLTRIYREYSY